MKIDYKSKNTNHVILLAKTQEGLKNLYKLVSKSHLEYFYKKPRIPKSVLTAHREGLVIGSACEAGEVYQSILRKETEDEIRRIAEYYDYLEIQPLANNQFLVDGGIVADMEELKEINRKIVSLGKALGKPCGSNLRRPHYAEPEEALYRKILMAGQGL
jgi:DNA polymerase-3 subunit alpha (Gram-positive type)